MKSVKIDYEKIVNKIFSQFGAIKSTNEEYTDLVVFVDDEQSFIKRGRIENPYAIYIVVKFGEAVINHNSSVAPVTLLVFGIGNNIELTKKFLSEYTATYNLTRDENVEFIFSSPYALSNFNETGYDFRSLFSISGTILIGNIDSVYIDDLQYINENGDMEKISVLTFNDDTTNNLNPQVYGNSNGRTKSYGSFQTYVFSISLYAVNNSLVRDVMNAKYSNESSSNKEFKFNVKFSNGIGFENWVFKLKNATLVQNLGQIPVFNLTFSL